MRMLPLGDNRGEEVGEFFAKASDWDPCKRRVRHTTAKDKHTKSACSP